MKPWFDQRRVRLLGIAATVLALGVLAFSYRRGTKLAPPALPASAADGARCGLVGEHRVRCVLIAPASVDQVWAQVTGYAHYPELFHSPLFRLELSSSQADAGERWRLRGSVAGWFYSWPFEVETTHLQTSELRTVSWEQLSGALKVDRGVWKLEPRSAHETRITYEIEVAVEGAPPFIVNDMLLDNLPAGLEHLAEVASKAAP
jgi:uncharacterized membrane protein